MDLATLKRQHEDIVRLVIAMKELLNKEALAGKTLDASLKLAELSGKLSLHLSAEDKFLYPKLLDHPDTRVQNTARRFNDEMANIASAFTNYKNKYLSAAKIKADPEGFIKDTKVVFAILEKRVLFEEQELYPLLGKS